MRAPVDFVVTRHLLSDPDASPAQIAKRCGLRATSVARAYTRLRGETGLRESLLFRHLLDVKERPHWSTLHFQIPNPEQWKTRFHGPCWFSGEVAAAMDGYDLVPQRWLVYLQREDMQAAVDAARDEFARVAGPSDANLSLRVADPWLYLDPGSDLVERGQRLLDYWSSRHVQLTAELMHAPSP